MEKKISLLLILILIFSAQVFSQFTTGNLVVVRIGNGNSALSNASAPVFLDEYTTAGVFVASYPLPLVQSGSNYKFVNSGSATSEGALTLSPDGKFLCLAGYDADTAITGIVSNATYDRVIARVDKSGNILTNTKIPQSEGYATNNIRGAVTLDGTAFWTSGTGTGGGVRYIALGSTSGSIQISSTITNVRVVNIFNNQLFISSATGAFQGISTVGTGLPVTTGQTITLLNGFPTASGPSSYAFSVNSASNLIYVADDRTTPNGGIQRWSLNSGTWMLDYTLNTNLTGGCRGLVVDWSGANPVIYAVTSESTQRLVKVTDTGSLSSFTELVSTPGTNKVFRGISFAPYATITGITNNNIVPNDYSLEQNYPNPFNPVTKINFSLPKDSKVDLRVYDALGREVSVLANGFYSAGIHSVNFNAENIPGGAYFCKILAGDFSKVTKMMLVK